jgi:CubicO group peptidase (beta-lactamase class C family)
MTTRRGGARRPTLAAAGAFLALVASTSGTPASPAPISEAVEDLQRLIDRGRARAAAIGWYDRGESRVIGLGRLDGERDESPRGDTLFEIGSVGKVFTALLTQVLVEAGALDWDGTIGSYLPQVDFSSDAVAAITLRELATHTSGLPRLPDNMEIADPLDPYAGYEREDLLEFLAGHAPDRLDKTYAYSNLGAGLLGQIAADAAGTSYGDAIHARVASPLGMLDTRAGIDEAHRGRLAGGYSDGADMPNWGGFDALAGAGALVSSVDDLLRFVAANLEDGDLAAALAAIREPQANGETGLGWHIRRLADGTPVHWHNGGTGGYASFLALRADSGTGVVVLTASTAHEVVTEIGFRLITGERRPAPGTDLDRYAGTYRLGEGFVLVVFVEEGRLFGQATGQGAFPLSAIGEHVFGYAPADIRVVFSIGEADAADALTLYQAGRETPAPRVADAAGIARHREIDLDPSLLDAYAGRYLLAPGAVLTVERRGPRLFAALTGQPAFPVFPYAEDRFFYKIVDAQLEFERDASGKVIAVTLHQVGQRRAPRIDDP